MPAVQHSFWQRACASGQHRRKDSGFSMCPALNLTTYGQLPQPRSISVPNSGTLALQKQFGRFCTEVTADGGPVQAPAELCQSLRPWSEHRLGYSRRSCGAWSCCGSLGVYFTVQPQDFNGNVAHNAMSRHHGSSSARSTTGPCAVATTVHHSAV